ncbi:MAG: hypothetical protein LUD29_03380 [Clostridia bacterium]|nr:hypothetical protein [Clostridia bacterium]
MAVSKNGKKFSTDSEFANVVSHCYFEANHKKVREERSFLSSSSPVCSDGLTLFTPRTSCEHWFSTFSAGREAGLLSS